ncbi:MAG: hypothetical protein ACRDRA_03575 [Pseudonocardiaceae bacterium]
MASVTARLSAYAAALALVLGGAWAAGAAVGPILATSAAEHSERQAGHTAGDDDGAAGLAVTRGGYTFAPMVSVFAPGVAEEFAFRITGPDGAPVTRFEMEQDKLMHLIVVRRDLSGYQHLHPQMDAGGTWRVRLTLPAGGSYRAFADFIPTGAAATTLGVDLAARGEFVPAEHRPNTTAQLPGGYQVNLDGDLISGQSSKLTLTVSKDGQPVTDLQPYLGAYGHLVALRGADLAYLHVHPEGVPGDGRTAAGPQIVFSAEVPSAADYRLFLDFQHHGAVRTAEFTLPARQGQPQPASEAETDPSHDGGHQGAGHG